VRECLPADIPRVIEMGTRFLATKPFGPAAPSDPARLEAAVDVCLRTGTILLSEQQLFVETRITGMFCLYAMEHPFTGEPMAEELAWWVEPEHRNGTAGVRLLRSAIEWATTSGVACLRMNAPNGTRVGTILERHGFRPVETAYVLRF
jgi:GNAT superfamily N-acetyltransferase